MISSLDFEQECTGERQYIIGNRMHNCLMACVWQEEVADFFVYFPVMFVQSRLFACCWETHNAQVNTVWQGMFSFRVTNTTEGNFPIF